MATKTSKPQKEVPYQNYSWIKRSVLSKMKSNDSLIEADLFRDPCFPPDLSSLTYVYSGNDRYEKMQFKRPKEIKSNATTFGIGGVLNSPFPWKHYRKRKWLEAAAVIVSLSVRYLEKLIPGYRLCDQCFGADYVGAFHFNIWRFGEWVEVILDDNLPVLGDSLVFCSAFGNPPEFWPPLLEKAYAKLMQTYEAIENGNTLDVLTDFTGAICEYFTPDINPPEHLFHILYKSTCSRSFIVCWRNEKRLTPTGFHHCREDEVGEDSEDDEERYLHLVTATTKVSHDRYCVTTTRGPIPSFRNAELSPIPFPTTDGRLLELVRLKCPFPMEPRWHGKYCDSDTRSWETLDLSSLDKCHPLMCKDADEYWMLFEDFRCNFGGLIICSSKDPFRAEGFNVARVYGNGKDQDFDSNLNMDQMNGNRPLSTNTKVRRKYSEDVISKRGSKGEILVKEGIKTVKVDSTSKRRPNSAGKTMSESGDTFVKYLIQKRHSHDPLRSDPLPSTRMRRSSYISHNKIDNYDHLHELLESAMSARSVLETENSCTYSTSDIFVQIPDNQFQQNSLRKKRSSSYIDLPRNSTGSISHLTQSNFLATKIDSYRSNGAWKQFLEQEGTWTKSMSPGSRDDMKLHSKNPRIHLAVTKPQTLNEQVNPSFRGKSHLIISLLQDYRHGPSTANSLLVPIGFCIYKTKCPNKDEKRNLSKLKLVGQLETKGDAREVNGRFDLEEGHFMIVPYCMAVAYEGKFLVRILGEKDCVAGKSGCSVS